MYRLVAKRLLRLPVVQRTGGSEYIQTTRTLGPAISKWSPSFCTTVESPPPSQNPSIPLAGAGASSTTAGKSSGGRSQQPRAQYQDEQARVLNASLRHVVRTLSFFLSLILCIFIYAWTGMVYDSDTFNVVNWKAICIGKCMIVFKLFM